jgi:hypothetical protein
MRGLRSAFFVLGTLLFCLLLRRYGFSSLFNALMRQGAGFWLTLIPTAAAALLFALAWWLLLDRESRGKLRFTLLFWISLAGSSLNYLLPFAAVAGEPVKAVCLARHLGRRKAVGSVLAYNVIHLLSHLLVYLAAVPLAFWLLPRSLGITLGLLLAGLLALTGATSLILLLHRGCVARLHRLAQRLPRRLRGGDRTDWWDRLRRYEETVRQTARERPAGVWLALAADFLGRILWTAELTVMMRNVGQWLDPLRAFLVHSLSGMMMVPAFYVPYEVGVKEAGLCLCLKLLGMDPSLGVFLGVATRLREAVWIAISLVILAAIGLGWGSLRALARSKPEVDVLECVGENEGT